MLLKTRRATFIFGVHNSGAARITFGHEYMRDMICGRMLPREGREQETARNKATERMAELETEMERTGG